MAIYQIYSQGKKRIPNSFNSKEDAQVYVSELKKYAELMIRKGQYHFFSDLKEIKNLEIKEIKSDFVPKEKRTLYSVVESSPGANSVISTHDNYDMALDVVRDILDNGTNRNFTITETVING